MRKLSFLISLLLLVGLQACQHLEYKHELSALDIQERIAKKFPIEKDLFLAQFMLSNPQVAIANNKIQATIAIDGNYLGDRVIGTLKIDGEPYYKKAEGKIYVRNVQLLELIINHKQVNDKAIANTIEKVIRQNLETIPVYRLNEKDFKKSLVKMMLKSIHTENDKLILTFGA